MQLDQIEQAMEAKRQERDSVIAELKVLARERDAIQAQIDAEKMVSGLSPAEQDALLQRLQIGSINSSTVVGGSKNEDKA